MCKRKLKIVPARIQSEYKNLWRSKAGHKDMIWIPILLGALRVGGVVQLFCITFVCALCLPTTLELGRKTESKGGKARGQGQGAGRVGVGGEAGR